MTSRPIPVLTAEQKKEITRLRALDGEAAMNEYRAAEQATDDNTKRLRALRLEREAAEAVVKAEAKKAKKDAAAAKKPRSRAKTVVKNQET